MCLIGDECADGVCELIGIERLGDYAVGAEVERLAAEAGLRGQHEHGHFAERRIVAPVREHVEPVPIEFFHLGEGIRSGPQ